MTEKIYASSKFRSIKKLLISNNYSEKQYCEKFNKYNNDRGQETEINEFVRIDVLCWPYMTPNNPSFNHLFNYHVNVEVIILGCP